MKFTLTFLMALTFSLGTPSLHAQGAPSAAEIVGRLESIQNPSFMTLGGTMNLKDRFGTRSITFNSWSLGDDRMLIEFTSDAEYGQKILRVKKDLYIYYPDADKTIPVRGSAMGDSVMGSDMSYEDLTGNKSLLESYEVVLKGEEKVLDRDCWVLELTAKSRDVAYSAQTLWVDKELYVTRQTHQFARSGRLLRTMKVLEVTQEGRYLIPTKMVMEDQLKRGSGTEFILKKLDLTTPVAERRFRLQELGK